MIRLTENRPQSILFGSASLAIAISVFGWALLHFLAVWHWFHFYLDGKSIPYFFYVSVYTLRPTLALCLIPSIILLMLFVGFAIYVIFVLGAQRHTQISSWNVLAYGFAILILVFADGLAWASLFPGILSGMEFTQYRDERLGVHLYRLDFISASNGPGSNDAFFELWECDSLGLICSDVHDEDVSTYILTPREVESTSTGLLVSANSISMQINGKVVYVYSPH